MSSTAPAILFKFLRNAEPDLCFVYGNFGCQVKRWRDAKLNEIVWCGCGRPATTIKCITKCCNGIGDSVDSLVGAWCSVCAHEIK